MHTTFIFLTPDDGPITILCADTAPTTEGEKTYTVSPGNSVYVIGKSSEDTSNSTGAKTRVEPLKVGDDEEARCYTGLESSQGSERYQFEPNEAIQFVHINDYSEAAAKANKKSNLNATKVEDTEEKDESMNGYNSRFKSIPPGNRANKELYNYRFDPAGYDKKAGIGMNESSGGKRKRSRKGGVAAAETKNRTAKGGKRKLNPFMKFASQERKKVMTDNPKFAIPEIGKELGKRWRALSDAEKKRYA